MAYYSGTGNGAQIVAPQVRFHIEDILGERRATGEDATAARLLDTIASRMPAGVMNWSQFSSLVFRTLAEVVEETHATVETAGKLAETAMTLCNVTMGIKPNDDQTANGPIDGTAVGE